MNDANDVLVTNHETSQHLFFVTKYAIQTSNYEWDFITYQRRRMNEKYHDAIPSPYYRGGY